MTSCTRSTWPSALPTPAARRRGRRGKTRFIMRTRPGWPGCRSRSVPRQLRAGAAAAEPMAGIPTLDPSPQGGGRRRSRYLALNCEALSPLSARGRVFGGAGRKADVHHALPGTPCGGIGRVGRVLHGTLLVADPLPARGRGAGWWSHHFRWQLRRAEGASPAPLLRFTMRRGLFPARRGPPCSSHPPSSPMLPPAWC